MSIRLLQLFCCRWFVVGKVLMMICWQDVLEKGKFAVPVSPRMQEVEFGEVSSVVEGVG